MRYYQKVIFMLHFCLNSPVSLLWFGEFISPERDWKHLTRTLLDYELMVVTEGTLYIADEREEHCVRAGEYLIMPPTRHQHGTRICKCRFYWMHFCADAQPSSLSLPAHGKFTDGERIAALAGALFKAEAAEPRGLFSRYLASEFLLELAFEQSSVRKEAEEPLSPKRALCEKAKNYVEWHKFSDIRVREIARELGYHEKYLSAVFRETEGISIKRYLTARRIAEAERLLTETTYTAAEVAYYLNFESPHNFSRFFKKETGATPLEYRAEHSKT